MTESIAYVDIKNGTPVWYPDQRQALRDWCAKQADGKYFIALQKDYPDRSLGQNNYKWGLVLTPIMHHVNEGLLVKQTLRDIADAFLEMFGAREIVKIGTFQVERIKRLSAYNTKEEGEFIENIRAFALSEWGMDIPDPDPAKRRR